MKCIYKHCNKELVGQQKKFCSSSCANTHRTISWRHSSKTKALDYKGNKCEICGYSKSKRALCFHHKDPSTKEFEINSKPMISWEKLKLELDKCLLLCANCHAEEHDKEVPGAFVV